MAKKVLLAGILGGIVMFFWGFVWHEALGMGLLGIKDTPNDQAVIAAMKSNVPEAGFYIFPAVNIPPNASSAQKKAAQEAFMQKATSGPAGFLIYQPVGKSMTGGMLMTEFGTNVAQALLVAFLLAQTGLRRFSSRLGFVFVVGIVAAITTNISYWNWYGFSGLYTFNNMFYLVVGYFLIGLVVAGMVKAGAPRPFASSAAAAA